MDNHKFYIPPIAKATEPFALRTFATCAASNLQIKDTLETALREVFDPYCQQLYTVMCEQVNKIFQDDVKVQRVEVNLHTTQPNMLHIYVYNDHSVPQQLPSIEIPALDYMGLEEDSMALGHYLIDAYGFQKDSSDIFAKSLCLSTEIPLAPLE